MRTTELAPEGATHKSFAKGECMFHRRRDVHSISEFTREWQKETRWEYWSQAQWIPMGRDFGLRKMNALDVDAQVVSADCIRTWAGDFNSSNDSKDGTGSDAPTQTKRTKHDGQP